MEAFCVSFAVLAAGVMTAPGSPQATPRSYQLPAETAALRPGPNFETAQNNCVACHSVDYISTQPPNRGEDFWRAEVNKMINSFHAPIEEADARAIIEYLVKTY